MKKKLSLICACLMLVGSALYGVSILSVAGSNGSQQGGGALTLGTLANLYADLASVGTVLGPATGAPSGTGAVCLTTNCALVTPNLGTPSAINLTNATAYPSALITQSIVIPLTLSQLQTLNSVGVAVLPTPAATSAYIMGPCMLNLTHGSAAFTGGGTVTIGYGATAATTASNSTIASTVFTTFTASHLVVVEPTAQSVGATTLYAGLGVWMNAASADFASGTGGSGQLSCQYSVVTGVS